jgi:TetR/AcrR family transcriptional regulator
LAKQGKLKPPRPREPLQARAAETRARILEEAYNAFAERGFDGANMRDIAAAAGSSHAVIRYHFGSKEQLWRATVEDMFNRMRRELAEVAHPIRRKQSLNERLRNFLSGYIRYCAHHPNHARIVIHESMRGGERLQWMAEQFIRPDHDAVSAVIKALIDAKELPDVSPVALLYLIVSMCQLPFVIANEAQTLYGIDMREPAEIERLIDAVIAVLVRKRT